MPMTAPRRTWLFVAGADPAAHEAAARSAADVLIQELEDFTPPDLRPRARELARDLYSYWRSKGHIAAVRVNPLETCGREDLAAVLAGKPDIVLMSKVATPEQVQALASIAEGVDLVPNVETAAGLVRTYEIAKAHPRVKAALVASEDMVADLGTSRSKGGEELAYVRQRFLLECRAAGVEAIDAPYTFSDVAGAVKDARWAKQMGYRMKSLVLPGHAKALNDVLSISSIEIRNAKKIVEAFEKARSKGSDRVKVDGKLIEVPMYSAAKRLLNEHAQRVGASAAHTPPPQQRKSR
jgi:citrate lyase subunit beta/citryl-CoA lyase